ncbi:dienelactone hydrolase [Inquilinus ginsengisoli]|uniref:Dienelactone hydrolase n=1 Tax=Inquilinus ginsengisoli TaxID=363840 RepID=A0ABU1JGE1_9PROT|nr:dienelactone hydrolase family protein [Inquilinus ginsengisoli]MDR6287621.1 dienelactone hydrolase [Inquilinus ginsengisoli]
MFRLCIAILLLTASVVRIPAAQAQGVAPAETVMFKSLSGEVITGRLFLPQGAGPFPAVVGLHGSGGYAPAHDRWATRLTASGYAMFLVDSYTARGYREIISVGLQTVPVELRVKDAVGALEYLQTRKEINPKEIAVLGWSQGATTAVAATATMRQSLIAKTAPHFAAAIALYPRCDQYMTNTQPVGDTPLLVLMGSADTVTPAAACGTLFGAWLSKGAAVSLIVYPGQQHNFDFTAPTTALLDRTTPIADPPALSPSWTPVDDAERRTLGFLDRRLGLDSVAASGKSPVYVNGNPNQNGSQGIVQ